MVKKACLISFDAHKEDYDKAGYPYFMHPFTLAYQMTTEDAVCVALMHDVIEDHGDRYTFEYLEKVGFNERIISALRLLTHDKNVDYMDYVAKIKENELARTVKIADLKHNLNTDRTNGQLPKKAELYLKALKYLTE